MKGCLLVPSVDEHTVVAVESKRDAVLGVLCTGVNSHIVTVVKSVAEDFVHPVGAGGSNPRVLGSVPTVRKSEASVSVRKLAHFDLLLSIQALRKVAC